MTSKDHWTLRPLFQLSLVAVVTWSMVYGRNTLAPLQETMQQALGLTDNQIAWLQGPAIAVPMALGAIPFGLWADRHSRVALLLWFTGLDLAANGLTVFASSYPLLVIARGVIGLAQAALIVGVYSLVADCFTSSVRGRANMVAMIGEIAGSTAAFALGGLALSWRGAPHEYGLEAWRWALLVTIVPLVPALLLMLLLKEPPRTGLVIKNPPLYEVLPQLRRYRGAILPLLLARILVWIADGAVIVWGAPMFARTFHLQPKPIGAIMGSALLIGGILGAVLGGLIADVSQRRGGPRYTMCALMILALLSAPTGLFAMMPSIWSATVALASFLMLGYAIATAGITLGTIVLPGELRGLYLGVMLTLGSLFYTGAAPVAVSGLSSLLGGENMIGVALAIVCAGTSLIGAAVFASGIQRFPRHANVVCI